MTDRAKTVLCYLPMPEGQTGQARAWAEQFPAHTGIRPVLLPPVNWNDDLTPWPADPIFRKGKSFGGKAAACLDRLVTAVIPSLEADLGIVPDERWLAGVSLAGLFAVWASAESGLFTRVASVSGSFWYPGFPAWLEMHPVRAKAVYLSLGDQEARGRNPHLRSIADDTAAVVRILERQGVPTRFEQTAGTHFAPLIPRLERALQALAAPDETQDF